ncbi:MAG: Unknown protein [uncultured Aureispira sp.]|uniref:Lipoprotein n=1 Tax=uncultured Aureispira sp. TaxID=1331704 RepID=A0A6S6S9S4_9BACT|nr:MAG: Unknown protein [uncultured Aureispira sp.]
MNFKLAYLILAFLVLTTSCGSDASEKEPQANDKTELSDSDKALVEDVMKEEVVTVEPQATFDQSQLNNNILTLCVKFKTLNGADRKEVFSKFESILPSCPVELKEDNEFEPNVEEAVQVMSINDLKEFLGEPNEIREDGMLVYDLMADKSYQVAFMPGPLGAVVCRFYEADS